MRVSGQDGPLAARAIAGSRVVLLAMDLPRADAGGLLGFALSRRERGAPPADADWLPNFLRFEVNAHEDGPTTTDDNPVQEFVWGDYVVDPGARLTYRVEARYGEPDAMEARHAVELDVDVERTDDGHHGVFFNRGAPGSQAYAERFHNQNPLGHPDAEAWLSRGLEEALLHFIEGTKEGAGLRGAFYEFHHDSVLEELAKAAARGVDVKLVVARPDPDKKGKERYPGEANVEPVHDAGLDEVVTWRRRCAGIPHNKFLIRLDGDEPEAVWTGSTNITDGAFYGQSNLGHLIHHRGVAAAYLGYWKHLHQDPETDALRDLNEGDNELPDPASGAPAEPVRALFSPHHGERELRWFAHLIEQPDNQAVFFTAPFGIGATFEAALKTEHAFPIYALLDKGDDNMEVLRAVPGNELTAGAFLGEGGWRQFLEEKVLDTLNPNVSFVHTKYLLVNPLSDDPLVITGSANFSPNSVANSDENMLVIRGDERVADIYLTEFMRLFTHMYFRGRVAGDADKRRVRAPTPESRGDGDVLYLRPDDSWTTDWYEGDGPKKRERELFAAG